MDSHKVNAIIASAFNLAAAETPELRTHRPNGMSPAIAATLPRSVRLGWLESYADRMNKLTPAQRKAAGHLYGPLDAQAAIDFLTAGE